jgi:hypothetical protein
MTTPALPRPSPQSVASDRKLGPPSEEYSACFEGSGPTSSGAQQPFGEGLALRRAHAWLRRAALVGVAAALVSLAACGPKVKPPTTDAGAPDAGKVAVEAGASVVIVLDAGAAPAGLSLPAEAADSLGKRGMNLLEAVRTGNGDLALDLALPKEAYLLGRDLPDPLRQWEKQVHEPYLRSIERLGKRHPEVGEAKFVALEPGKSIVQVPAKRKGWKQPVWKSKNCTLVVMKGSRTMKVPVGDMINWKGVWYFEKLGR